MPQTSFALLTNTGRAKEAAALANATTIEITHIAIGDGATVPSGGETALYNEIARKTISGHGTVTGAENVAYFDCYLAAPDGPYTIREAGLYDSEGDLIAIAHYDPPINKPVPVSGQTVEATVRLEVAFSNIATVVIKVDPAMLVALQRLTQLPWIAILELGRNDPPAAPVPGEVYVIGSDPTGAWAGHAGKVAEYTIAGWALLAPRNGHGVGLPDGRVFERVGGAYVEKIALDVQAGKWLYAVAGGTANALTATLTPAPAALVAGMAIRLKIASANTDVVTLDLNGLGAKPVRRADGAALLAGDLVANSIVGFVFDAAADIWRHELTLRSDIIKVAAAPVTIVRITTPGAGSWTVPVGVLAVDVELWGGGGGGGYNEVNGEAAPSGGASGAYARRRVAVIPGNIINYTVGAGGLGGNWSPQRSGQPGTATTVTISGATMTAGGGNGGRNTTVAGELQSSPVGPGFSGADYGIRGGTGGLGFGHGVSSYAGAGGSAPLGGQASGGGRGAVEAANAPGGGGGSSQNWSTPGAAGAHGEVRFTFLAG